MANNILESGQPRLCWFVDGDDETPDIAVMLEDTGSALRLTLPMRGMWDHDDPYRAWFSFGDGATANDAVPRNLLVHDNSGSVALAGCRGSAWSRGATAGFGHIVATYAVLGGRHLDYDKVNGLRSFMPAMAEWAAMKSVHIDHESDNQGRVQSVDLRLESPPNLKLSDNLNLTLRPAWRNTAPDQYGTYSVQSTVEIETFDDDPQTWDDHLNLHTAMRDLLVISAWRRLGFHELWANRVDDPERALSGEPIFPRWNVVKTHQLPKHEEWVKPPTFLFGLSDIGADGVREWLSIRQTYARAMQPLAAIPDQQGSVLETLLMLSGVALECLAYQLAVDKGGTDLNRSGQVPSARIGREWILADMVYVPFEDTKSWAQDSATYGNAVKHPDRPMPPALDLLNMLRQNVQVLRFWVAGRLGLDRETLARRAETDLMNSPRIAPT